MTLIRKNNGRSKSDAAWTAAVRLQQFGYGEICRDVSISPRAAAEFVKSWEQDGKIRAIEATPLRPSARKMFEVVPVHELRVVPDLGDGIDQMWTAMRKLVSFTGIDLSAYCAAPVPVEEARAYCRLLLAGGYLKVIQKAVPNRREAIYRLTNVTGVVAPRERRVRCIVDANLGRILPLSEGGA